MSETYLEKRKVAIIGSTKEMSNLLSLLKKDDTINFIGLVNKEKASSTPGDYGHASIAGVNVKVYKDYHDLPSVDLVVDASGDPRIHSELYKLYPEPLIINDTCASLLWELKGREGVYGNAALRHSLSLQRVNGCLDSIDLTLYDIEVYNLLIELSKEITGADVAGIFLAEKGEDNLILAAWQGFPIEEILSKGVQRIGRGVVGLIAKERKPLLISKGQENSLHTLLLEEYGINSLISIPVLSNGTDLLALLMVCNKVKGALAQSDLAFLSQLCARSERYIVKAMAIREIREESIEQALLGEVRNLLDLNRPMDERVQLAIKKISEQMGLSGCTLFTSEDKELTLRASLGANPRGIGIYAIRKGYGFPLLFQGIPSDFLMSQPLHGPWTPKGIIYLPLISRKRSIGVLIMEFPSPLTLSKRRLKIIREISQLLAEALANEEEKEQMSQKIIKVSAVNEEGLELISMQDREKVLLHSAASASVILESEFSILRLFNSSGRLEISSSYGDPDAGIFQLDEAIANNVAKSGRALLIPDLSTTEYKGFSQRSVLSVPIFQNERLIGTLSVYNKITPKAFSGTFFNEDDKDTLKRFTHYVGRALLNIEGYQTREGLITIDKVTGLKNERYLQIRIEEEFMRASRYNRSVSLAIIDVTEFQEITKGLDKPSKDDAIRKIAGVIKDNFRNVDVIIRLKDSTFAVIMPDTGVIVHEVIQRLEKRVRRLMVKAPGISSPHTLSLRVGYCTYPAGASSIEELLEKAMQLKDSSAYKKAGH